MLVPIMVQHNPALPHDGLRMQTAVLTVACCVSINPELMQFTVQVIIQCSMYTASHRLLEMSGNKQHVATACEL